MAIGIKRNQYGGGGQRERILYDAGSWSIAYDNPGSYTYTGVTVQGATINANNVSLDGSSSAVKCIGSTNKIDVTNYSLLKIRAKRSGTGTCELSLRNNKAINDGANVVAYTIINNSNDYVESVIDVSGLSGKYYLSLYITTSSPQNTTFDKLWLE